MDMKLSKTNIRNQVGGSLLSLILSLGRTLLPTIGKTLGLSALSGLASEGASQALKAITGKGSQIGGFLIPQNKMHMLIPYKDLLNMKQKNDLLNALQMEKAFHIKPTNAQTGGFLGTLLASIGIPMAVYLVKNLISGKGSPRMGLPKMSPPFYSYPQYVTGQGAKKKKEKKRKRITIRKKQPIQQYSNFRRNIIKPKFHKNIALTNNNLLNWCEYLNILINVVLSRNKKFSS